MFFPDSKYLLLVVFLLASGSLGAEDRLVCFMDVRGDDCLTGTDPVAACEARLGQANPSMTTRLSLCEALLSVSEFSRAAVVVDGALRACGSNRALCSSLQLARSNVEEQLRKSSAEDPDTAERNQRVLRDYCMGRVASEGSVDACAQLLAADLADMAVLSSLGGKLLTLGRPTDALRSYRRVEAQEGASAELSELIDEALRQRSALVDGCIRDGDLDNCNDALLPGEEDEFALYRKRGALLAADGRLSDASLDLAAGLSIATDKRSMARDILRILPAGTGSPNALRVRADALVLTGNHSDALQTYQRALSANPNDDVARKSFRALLGRRDGEIERVCIERRDRSACEALLVVGAPDESKIRTQLAEIDLYGPAVELDPVLDTELISDPIADVDAKDEESFEHVSMDAYPGNSIRPDGRTY